MSLDWNIRNVEKKGKDLDPSVNALTNSFIYMTMIVDIGEITKSNVNEFAFRVNMYERCINVRMPAITKQDVTDYIGLKVNVITKTRAAFMKKIATMLTYDLE